MSAAERRRIPILTKTRTPRSLGTPLSKKISLKDERIKKTLTTASLETTKIQTIRNTLLDSTSRLLSYSVQYMVIYIVYK